MKTIKWITLPIAALALGFAPAMMTGCEGDSDLEDAAEDVEDAAEDAKDKIKEGAEEVEDEIDDATTD